MAERILIGGRQQGKSWAAATRLGLSMDEYRELMRQQRERIDSARSLIPPPPPREFFRSFWLGASRPHVGHHEFMREYLCEFDSPAPELMGPPAPTFEQWEASQRADANAARWERLGLRGYRWEFNRPGWD